MIGTSKSVWGFDPRTIPGCQLWLDAADQNVMTLSGSTVTQWKDKSGNVKNTTSYAGTPTLNASAINGRQAITLNGSSSFTGSITGSGNTLTVCIVGIQGSGCATSGGLLCFGRPGYSDWQDSGSFTIEEGQLSGSMFSTRASVSTQRTTTGVNTPFIYILIFDGTYANTYTNGTFQSSTSSSGSFAYTEYKIGTRAGNTQNVFWTGFIGEALVYNSALTTSERQQVEGYLAHKWGLVPYYDSSIPLTIPGCQLWLDGADPAGNGVVPANGTTISTWVDKSGNGRNATPTGTGPTYTTNIFNGYSAPVFNGTTMVTPSYLITTDSKLSIFILCKKTGLRQAGGNSDILSIAAGYQYFDVYIRSSVNNYLELIYANTSISLTTYAINDGTNLLITILTNGLSINGYLGGTSVVNTTAGSGGYPLNNLTSRWNISEAQFVGPICEIIIFNSTFTNAQRQTIEGYLAKKWGIGSTPTIPSSHPFSSVRPHLRTFQPTDVPGCALWLDAADQSSLVLSGSNVTQWSDKSGNGNNAVAGTAVYPIYNIKTLNNIPVIGLENGSDYFLVSNNFTVTDFPSITYFCVFSPTSTNTASFAGILSTDTPGAYGRSLMTTNQTIIIERYSSFTTTSYTLTPNTWYLVSLVFNGTSSIDLTVNGIFSTYAPTSLSFNNTSGFIIGSAPTDSYTRYNTNIDIAEVMVFGSALSTSQRQQIEGYLAHKWGLTLSLPVISPLSIPGCQLWFDAADSSTVAFSSGSNVSVWTNKGIVSTTATPTRGPSANQITYTTIDGYPGVYINNNGSAEYNSSTYSQLTIQSNFQNTADYSVFAVVNLSNVTGASMQTIYGNERGTSGETRSPNFGAGQSFEFNAAGGSRVIDLSFIGSGRLQTALISSSSAFTAYTNATAYGSNTNGLTRFSTDAGPLPRIGGAFGSINDPRFATGYFHEILFYNSALTTSQRQQIEGYLARKWGISISATLPSPHPFKSFPPASLPFSPRNISGLQLWLDGADQSSITLSGSSVTQWSDKSGNGNNMNTLPASASWSGSAAYPTIGTSINGLQTVKFLAQSGLKQATTLDGVKNLFWVGRIAAPDGTAGPDAAPVYFLLGHDTLYDWHGDFYGSKFVTTGAAQSGITSATASLFTSDSNAVTNATFGNVNMPSAPNISLLSVSGITGSTRYQGICYDRNTHPGWCGDLAEVIVFNTALTTSQRQQIEGYLAHKWGLTGSLPSSHPFKKLPA